MTEFCSGIARGESIDAVTGRFAQYGLQPGGVPPATVERVKGMVAPEALVSVTGLLAEPTRSPSGPRPVCAVFYSDRRLGGDGAVIFSELKEDWEGRY